MNVLYISPSPPPPVPGTDGLFTEIGYLRNSFGGELISLTPFRAIPPVVPVMLYGIQHLFTLKKYKKEHDIIHLFFPYLVDFQVLRDFSRPVIFTVTSGVEYSKLPRTLPDCTFVVSSDGEADILESRGIEEVRVIRPGIETSLITITTPPRMDQDFTILMGSAPWIKSQFSTKGFDLILEVLKKLPGVRVICLWRGRLYREWREKVRTAGLTDRVEIVNERVDISKILSQCHAAMVLATRPDLVKSYPNSLMEALVAGRPVIISRAVPMSWYVDTTGCGMVVEKFSVDEIVQTINEMKSGYDKFGKAASLAGKRDFSDTRMIDEYGMLYQEKLG